MLIDLTTGLNFTNVLQAAFTRTDIPNAQKRLTTRLSFLRFCTLCSKKLLVNMLVESTLDDYEME